MLVNGRRFSLRVYVAATQSDSLRVFFGQSYFRIFMADKPENEESVEQNRHFVTNNIGSMSYTKVYDFLMYLENMSKLKQFWEETLPKMQRGFGEFFSHVSFLPPKGFTAFEIFGCDVLLDINLIPYLLECNPCSGVFAEAKSHATLFEELLYISLYQHETNEIPDDIHHWVLI